MYEWCQPGNNRTNIDNANAVNQFAASIDTMESDIPEYIRKYFVDIFNKSITSILDPRDTNG